MAIAPDGSTPSASTGASIDSEGITIRTGAGKRAARLDRDDVRVARQESILGGEARAVQTRFLGPRDDGVDVMRRSLVPETEEQEDDEGASGQVVSRAHADLVARDLGGG